jgi:hypothetical protein|tara:strand:- start:7753 stop:7947 length:195 start_codon:yes stop_codon:yes gene_type:complete
MTTRGAKKRLGTGQHRIAVVLPKKTYYALVKAAKDEDRSISGQTRHIVNTQLKQRGYYDASRIR